MKRNRLSHKKAKMISATQKANTSNHFIIYGQLEVRFRGGYRNYRKYGFIYLSSLSINEYMNIYMYIYIYIYIHIYIYIFKLIS